MKLAQNIVKNNPNIAPRELNYAVQMIIDRIIFLRISEDRGVELEYLLHPLANGERTYPRLLEIFDHADKRYNSGLFHFGNEAGREGPDIITPHLKIDNSPLREIIASVYYPSPFEFSVFPADILGQVYEQFLGKVIRISGRTAEVESKPEVKKAGGVYYTPTYIVDYIVHQTVGKLVEGCTPNQVAKLTILDPACGSGSFLIGAYQFLLDWHLHYYLDNSKDKSAKGKNATIYQIGNESGSEHWRLTTAEKRRILLNNIYGVDIDTQAVEVTKLSLLLKVLEGESAELINNTLSLYKERALPDLEQNIKCGNSLIGPDFYEGKDPAAFDLDARLKINAFDWSSAFPKITANGGFDAVIGNPPYVSFGLRDVDTLGNDMADYYRTRYENSAEYKISLYAMFMQAGIDLLRPNGYTSYIVPDSFLLGRYFSKLRRYALDECFVSDILMINAKVFHGATIGISVVYCFQRSSAFAKLDNIVDVGMATNVSQVPDNTFVKHSYSQGMFERVEHNRFRMFFDDASLNLVEHMEAEGNYASEFISIHTGVRSKIGQKNISDTEPHGETWKRGLISGSEIGRYSTNYAGNYLNIDKKILWSGGWDPKIINSDKIMIRQTGDSLTATLDTEKFYHLNNVHSAVVVMPEYDVRYVLGFLNSKCLNHFYHLISLESGRAMAQTDIETLEKLPICPIDFANFTEKAKHDKMVMLVERMLSLHKDKAAARLVSEKNMVQMQIEAADKAIDALVYELYGLTDAEVATVEGAG